MKAILGDFDLRLIKQLLDNGFGVINLPCRVIDVPKDIVYNKSIGYTQRPFILMDDHDSLDDIFALFLDKLESDISSWFMDDPYYFEFIKGFPSFTLPEFDDSTVFFVYIND